jgi:predicted glycoside hydrolase/deacetylase ChbG (UPF0249 family)
MSFASCAREWIRRAVRRAPYRKDPDPKEIEKELRAQIERAR